MVNLILGCGYLGRHVADRWLAAGDDVLVVTRSAAKAAELAARGVRPIVADICRADFPRLPVVDTLLCAVGFDRSTASPQTQTDVYVAGLANVIESVTAASRFIYVSSTGVYGDPAGEWVDESTPCQPQRPSARVCWQAEELLRTSRVGQQAIVLRLAGIYGPGRVPRIAAVQTRQTIAASDGFLNLIHVDDAADVIVLAGRRLTPPALLNVADGRPVRRREFYGEVARLLGLAEPRFAGPDADAAPDSDTLPGSTAGPRASSRRNSSKRVRVDRLFAQLQLTLRYPDYRAGLASILT